MLEMMTASFLKKLITPGNDPGLETSVVVGAAGNYSTDVVYVY